MFHLVAELDDNQAKYFFSSKRQTNDRVLYLKDHRNSLFCTKQDVYHFYPSHDSSSSTAVVLYIFSFNLVYRATCMRLVSYCIYWRRRYCTITIFPMISSTTTLTAEEPFKGKPDSKCNAQLSKHRNKDDSPFSSKQIHGTITCTEPGRALYRLHTIL